MQDQPDEIEVVQTWPEDRRHRREPLLVLDRLERFLDDVAIPAGPLRWRRVGDGHSNVTFWMQRGAYEFVLRRGPRPPLEPSTHDMLREARIQRTLIAHDVPVPRILAVCADTSVLGVPFYLMEPLQGVVITDRLPPLFEPLPARQELSRAVIDTLAALHDVDVSDPAVAALGRADGYLVRQIHRFSSLWTAHATRDLPDVARLGRWLLDNLPATQRPAMIHGDFRMGNLMFSDDRPGRVLAMLDWEMATLGDPLADLGYLTATWASPATDPTPLELTAVTRLPGFFDREQLIQRYAELQPGLDLDRLPWYQVLALWKGAVFCEDIYGRWLAGERPDDTSFAPGLADGVPALLEQASRCAAGTGARFALSE